MTDIDPIIRSGRANEVVGLSYSHIRRLVRRGEFPPPIRLGPNSSGWRYSTLQRWLESRQQGTDALSCEQRGNPDRATGEPSE